ncbi:17881_t:CDS:2, partial [Dentiscutata erythropus]
VIYPESSGYTWQRDNSSEQSRIDAIWIPQKWSNKIIDCSLENLQLITEKEKIKTSTITSRQERFGPTINSLEKTWKTLKNIIIEAADH